MPTTQLNIVVSQPRVLAGELLNVRVSRLPVIVDLGHGFYAPGGLGASPEKAAVFTQLFA